MKNPAARVIRPVLVALLLSAGAIGIYAGEVGPVQAGSVPLAWPSDLGQPHVNATPAQEPGWRPTYEQIRDVRATAEAFFGVKDTSHAADAHALLTTGLQQIYPIGKYTDDLLKFNSTSGAAQERRIVAVTWSKDPAAAPAPGTYAALDFVARFENIDRYCGYLILYQSPSGGPFRVMRDQVGFLDNATAQTMAQLLGPARVEEEWAKLSRLCPNYHKDLPPLAEQRGESIGYPSVEAALAALHANPAVQFSTQSNWTVATENSPTSLTLWSFPPAGDPAYPAAVKRQLVQEDGHLAMHMHILCGAPKQACDNLARQYNELNAQLSKAMTSASH